MSKELYRKTIDAGAPAADYPSLEGRLAPRRGRWLLAVSLAACAAAAVFLFIVRPGSERADMSIYVGLSDRPASEALDIELRDWRNADVQALFGGDALRARFALSGPRGDAR